MNWAKTFSPAPVALALVLAVALPSPAATVHVPADQPTIQAGIDAASEGDTVLVAPGTYAGPGNRDIDFGSINLVLTSEAGPEFTVIDCEGTYEDPHRGIYMNGEQGPTTLVEGLTIRNGWANILDSLDGPRGAGMYCGPGCAPTIRRCTFEDNSASGNLFTSRPPQPIGFGGGLFSYGSLTITDCVFSGNRAARTGGGICCGGSPLLTDCLFTGNSSWGGQHVGGGAGGMYCSGSPTLTGCTFTGNSSDGFCLNGESATLANCRFEGSARDGVTCTMGQVTLTDCSLYGNGFYGLSCVTFGEVPAAATLVGCTIAGNGDGGLSLYTFYQPMDVQLTNCTIAANGGAGLLCYGSRAPVNLMLRNCIVAFNIGGCAVSCSGVVPEPTLWCCDIYGNEDGDWVGCIAEQLHTMPGNFSEDPLFCGDEDPDEAYTLREDSPCAPDNNPHGHLIGAWDVGCDATVVETTTWGAIKSMYR